MAVDITQPTAHDALSLEELALYHQMMAYRAGLGLAAIPLSKGLTATAGRHVVDTRENIWAANLVLPAGANLHSWSDAPYYGDHRAPQVMWDAPERIGAGYTGNGYEISAAGYGDIAAALAGWKGSPGHNAVIAQTGPWASPAFLAIGIGVETSPGAGPYGGRVFHVWFGHQADPTGVPDIRGTGGADNVAGTAFADRIFGLEGADTLAGGVGNDTLVGGPGDDTYRITAGFDLVVEAPGGGIDHVLAQLPVNLAAEVEVLTLIGAAAINANGNILDNRITGNGAANRLNGGAGADTIDGAGGADSLLGGPGNDSLVGGAADDTLFGGLGADTLAGGEGADHFRFTAAGFDRIADFGPDDLIEVSRAGFGGVLAEGALDVSRFSLGAPAGTEAQFVYNAANGVLRWDPDGAGGAPSVVVAILSGAPALSAADITVIA